MDKRFVRFKVAIEILEDKLMFMKILEMECKKYGIDVDKPYTYDIGFTGNDYIMNTRTIVVIQ